MRWRSIAHVVGIVLLIAALFMVPPCIISVLSGGKDSIAFAGSFAVTMVAGLALSVPRSSGKREELRHREGFVVVTVSWALVSLFGALPYLFGGTFGSFTDAYFEAMAGFTTTGASVLRDIEGEPHGILFWRSLTQWIGGMGIVLFSLAVLPMLGGGGMQLFKAEVPEITVDKLRPRIVDTAKALWYIYTVLTVLAAVMFMAGGMDLFDAVCHSFTTLATGGFSTKNSSLAFYNSPFIEFVAAFFMFLAGVNYTLYFFAFKGNFAKLLQSAEFRFYLAVTLIATSLITFDLWRAEYISLGESFQYGLFQVVSIMTTTGFATADYERWSFFSKLLLVILMFFGGMIGSTGGGMKQIRILVMLKQIYREMYQLIHPRAVTFLKVDGKNLTKEILGSIWGFLFLFLIICVLASLALTLAGLDMETSVSTVVSAICNVGPALGVAGPAENYASLPDVAKWILIFCMLVGRLEVYTVIVLFVPNFWRK